MGRAAAKTRFWGTFSELPSFLLAFALACVAMLVPALHALSTDDHATARAFFYTALLGLILFTLIASAIWGRPMRESPVSPLVSLFSVMALLPVLLALPFHEALKTTTFFNAYLEMVSAVTTTGATIFREPGRLSDTLHLWRAQVGWMGGFVMWTAAAAILAPLNLGGFEVTARAEPGTANSASNRIKRADLRQRLFTTTAMLFPVYAGLTGLLWVLLLMSGDSALVALCHAMSVMATSGISPTGGLQGAQAGVVGEVFILLFLVFSVSRLSFSTDTVTSTGRGLQTDPEFRLALVIVTTVPLLLFARHWLGIFDIPAQSDTVAQGLRALWGSVFTTASFLTTTGFTSADWSTTQNWSGLDTPGLILMGLALIGGGVATTAGGVKLLRVYALYRQGLREMEKLVHPSSVSGARGFNRRLQRRGAFIAWVFFMLFALTLAALNLGFAALGLPFEQSMVLSVAGLSNTGPLIEVATQTPIALIALPEPAKVVFAIAMVVGRLETLAIIALFSADLWRA